GKPVDQLEYSRAIGCLMYAMMSTRPDIAYAVGRLSRFTSDPSRQHWQAITRVVKYLKVTMNYGLSYVGYPSVLEAYSDASWINHVEDSSSTSGWVFLLGGGAILWASKKKTCITGSTMESKFVALGDVGKEADWLRNLIYEILIWPKPIAPISIHCDSAATLAKAYSQMYNGKSRHLGVRHSMIRELIIIGVISIKFVRSQHNLADNLTKGLARDLVIKEAASGSTKGRKGPPALQGAEIWATKGLPDKAKGNVLGMKIVKDQSGNTLRVSRSRFYNRKLVQTLLEGHFILSLEGSLSGDYDLEKNDVGMLDKFDRGLQTDVRVDDTRMCRKLRSYDAAHDGFAANWSGVYDTYGGCKGGYLAKGTRNRVRIRAKDSSEYCYMCLVKGYPWSKVPA
ncbi:hypothetical protein Tco_0869433, partial [Tanacetum coccineum]